MHAVETEETSVSGLWNPPHSLGSMDFLGVPLSLMACLASPFLFCVELPPPPEIPHLSPNSVLS